MREFIQAVQFAEEKHRGQVRKYTGEPYIAHPLEVAGLVWTATGYSPATCAAVLHDVVEDCGVTFEQLIRAFGDEVAVLVSQVTDVSRPTDGNREIRKALDRDHLAKASPLGKTIKLADLISNTRSIVQHDPNFAKVYLKEKTALLPLLKGGDIGLWLRAEAQTLGHTYAYK